MNSSLELRHPTSAGTLQSSTAHPDLDAARALRQNDVPYKLKVMAFEAPYLLEKMQSTGLVAEPEQARALFEEVKKYLLLSRHLRKPLPMSSALVDAAWHQFVLFTREYEAFCQSCLGSFFHHVPDIPSREPSSSAAGGDEVTPDELVDLYEASFGAMPQLWYDSECLRQDTRLNRARGAEVLSVRSEAEHALLFRGASTPELVCRVSPRASGALLFLAAHPCFLLRELPALKTPEERVTLCRPLVRYGILRIAV